MFNMITPIRSLVMEGEGSKGVVSLSKSLGSAEWHQLIQP
jgi:hypothetical protein